MLGAFAAAAVLFSIFSGAIAGYEAKHGITRGAPGSEATAMVFGEYFPNPGGKALTDDARATMPAGPRLHRRIGREPRFSFSSFFA